MADDFMDLLSGKDEDAGAAGGQDAKGMEDLLGSLLGGGGGEVDGQEEDGQEDYDDRAIRRQAEERHGQEDQDSAQEKIDQEGKRLRFYGLAG